MGHSTLLDIIFANIIGGLILMAIFRLNYQLSETMFDYDTDYILQENITTAVEMIEYDFRKIGFCYEPSNFPNGNLAIILATSNSITFLSDIDTNGTMNTIRYWLGDSTEMDYTPNPMDKPLWRQVDSNVPLMVGLGFGSFQIRYLDVLHNELLTPVVNTAQIALLEITISLVARSSYDGQFTNDPSRYDITWRQLRLASKNLANR